jgi:UDP-glucose 4-epimerase
VGDVVDANLRAAESNAGGAINIGTGVQTRVLDLIEALAPHAEGSFDPDMQPKRPGEVQHIALDFARAREELGWEPGVGLAEGLERTLASLR